MRPMSRLPTFRAALFACAFAVSPACAQTSFNATTAGGPVWNRPIEGAPPTSLSSVGTAVPYYAYAFTAPTAGYYDFLSVATNPANWDNYTFLYQNAFDPTKPLANALLGNDDFNTTGLSGFNGVSLLSQTTYYFVTTGFSNADYGTFTGTIKPSVSPPTYTTNFSGTTAGQPTWNRPIANGAAAPVALSTFAQADPFSVFKFNVTTTGAYSLISAGVNPANWDNYAFLYQNAFDPTKPLANALLGNDDLTTTGTAGFTNVTLSAGTTYYFVTTGYDNTDFGDYTLKIQGVGLVVPEPGAVWWLAAMLCGGLSLRRRALRVMRGPAGL